MATYDFTTGTLPAGAILTRAGPGTRVNASRLIVSEPADTPRFDYNITTGALRGLLVEPARSNRIAPNRDPSVAPWTRWGGSSSDTMDDLGNVVDPMGGNTARRYRIKPPSGTGRDNGRLIQFTATTASSQPRIFMKAGEAAAVGRGIHFGTLSSDTGSQGGLTPAQGLQRYTVPDVWTPIVGPAGIRVQFVLMGFGADTYYSKPLETDQTAFVFDVWGVTLEDEGGSGVTSHIDRSTSTNPPRAADVLTLPGATGDWTFTYFGGGTRTVNLTASNGRVTVPTDVRPLRQADGPGGGGAQLVADRGAITLGGQPAGLLTGHMLLAERTTIATGGQPAALLRGVRLNSDAGVYAAGGQPTLLRRGILTQALGGIIDFVGLPVALRRGRKLSADGALIAFTGRAAGFVRVGAMAIAAVGGSYGLAGNAAATRATRRMSALSTVYNFTGAAASLCRNRAVAAAAGLYAETGMAAGLSVARRLAAAGGSYAAAGRAVGSNYARRLLANGAAYLVAGGDARLQRGRRLLGNTGVYLLTGMAAVMRIEVSAALFTPASRRLTAPPKIRYLRAEA